MTDWQRRLPPTIVACGVIALLAITAMTPTPEPAQRIGQPSAAASPASVADLTPRIAIVYDVGGRGSTSFTELAWEGVKRAADEFDAKIEEVAAQPDDTDADRERRLIELAEAGYYPIFAVGSTWAGPVARVAPMYPRMWFGILDDGTVQAPNVIGIKFNDEQGSFLVGAAAALTSKTGNVGFVGAVRVPEIERYEAGYTAGARAADPDVQVQVAYLAEPPGSGGADDEAKGREAALAMYDTGADVIFGAGDADSGVIQAADERGLWAIGSDSDRYVMADPAVRGAILTSMLKRADAATFTITMEVATGVPKDGTNVFGLDRGGLGYAASGGFVDSIKARLDAFAAEIAAGRILVPTKP